MDAQSAGDSAEALADRLQRLAERRRQTARRQRSPSASSGDEAEGRMPPHRGAIQALRELLQERGTAYDGVTGSEARLREAGEPQHAGVPLAVSGWPTQLRPPEAGSCDTSSPRSMGIPAGLPQPDGEAAAEPAGSSSSSSSVPPTARLLIALSGGIGAEEAAAARQLRTAEMRDADAAACEAEAQRAELAALLLRQEAAAAERERQRQEREAELRRIQLDCAVQHLAAWRIARAWRRFLRSPGRLREVAAATRLQAAWRGAASRKRSAALLLRHRQRQVLLGELRSGVVTGDLSGAEQAATQLEALGFGAEARQLVEALESKAAEAAQALRTAVASGNAEQYRTAAVAAARYRHLEAAVREAAALFAARVAEAEAAVTIAVEGGPLIRFREAAEAAAALGVGAPFLRRAEQRVVERNRQASAALQAAVEAVPFSQEAFDACLQQAQRFGLHADAARAQRGLQLRRHRVASGLQQLASQGSAEQVEAVCAEAEQLGLAAEAEAAAARLEQRQEAAAGELREAAHRGSLRRYEAAAAAAATLHVVSPVVLACQEQLQGRQLEAEQRLQQAAERGSLAELRQRCQGALLLGMTAAVQAAEQRVHQRRLAAVEQLAASTQAACDFASAKAEQAEQGQEAALRSAAVPAGKRGQLGSWHSSARSLADAMAAHGAAAALAHAPPACDGWPKQLRGLLADARAAADLELEQQALTAVNTLAAHLEALAAEAQVVVVALPPCPTSRGSSCSGGSGTSRRSSAQTGCGCLSARLQLQLHSQRGGRCPGAGPPCQPGAGAAARFLACLREWRAMQQDVLLPLVADVAQAAAEGERGDADPADYAERAGDAGAACSLDVSGQGLASLELLEGCTSLTRLDLSTNAICSLEAIAALQSLRDLRASDNRLGSLVGVQALRQLTSLDASNSQLECLPCLAGLATLRRLDLSGNRLTSATVAAAQLPAGLTSLTSLRLSGNRLADVASWLSRPLPSLLCLDISGNAVASLEGLAAGAPLLQVLVASRNALPSLPPSMHLPFLRELWLGGNQLCEVAPAWPWMPSLRVLRLEDNQLTRLAPLQGFCALQTLDLSFNSLASLAELLASLAPLAGTGLAQLHLSDNPYQEAARWAQEAEEDGQGVQAPEVAAGAQQLPRGYRRAVFRALPQLQELNGQPVDPAHRQQHLRAAAWRRPPAALRAAAAKAAPGIGQEWEAETVLWLLLDPAAAELVQQAHVQQCALALAQLQTQAEAEGQPVDAAGVRLATALACLKQAAGAFRPVPCAAAAAEPGAPAGRGRQPVVEQMQRLFLLLASHELTAAAQGLLLLESAHYQQLLARLRAAATCIQAAWRGHAARRWARRLASEQAARAQAAAACCIQAAWRGWACRQRTHPFVQRRLDAWREQWRDAQQALLLHQQRCAAVCIQAAWRGWRVRAWLARARLALLEQQRHPEPLRSGGGSLDLELSAAALDGLLEGEPSRALAAFDAPEMLQPELAAAEAWPAPVKAAGGYSLASCGQPCARPAGAGQQPGWHGQRQVHGPDPQPLTGQPGSRCSTVGGPNPGAPQLPRSPQPRAAGPPPDAGAASDWHFEGPAAAAAFLQLRQKQQAAARRRRVQQQMRDPAARLLKFQCTTALGRSGSDEGDGGRRRGLCHSLAAHGSVSEPGSKVSSQRSSRGPSGRGGAASATSSTMECSLPALPSPRFSGHRQAPSTAGSGKSDHSVAGAHTVRERLPVTVAAIRQYKGGTAGPPRAQLRFWQPVLEAAL